MKKRKFDLVAFFLLLFWLFVLVIPFALGYIPIYKVFHWNPPAHIWQSWMYGLVYCCCLCVALFGVVLIYSLVRTIIQGIFMFIEFLWPEIETKDDKPEDKQ